MAGTSYQEAIPGTNSYRVAYHGLYWYVRLAAATVCAASGLGLMLARRRIPAWACSMLLVLAFLGAFPWIFDGLFQLVEPALPPWPALVYALEFPIELAFGLGPVTVGAAALGDRLQRRSATVLEWLGLGLALIALVLSLAVLTYLNIYNRTVVIEPIEVAMYVGILLGLAVLGPLTVWVFGSAWRRWLGDRYSPQGRFL
jgi:hypothetical protein